MDDNTCLADCECPCGWVEERNYTQEELTRVVEQIQEKLKISKEELSGNVSKYVFHYTVPSVHRDKSCECTHYTRFPIQSTAHPTKPD